MNNGLFDNVYNPDVLSCLANLSNDEVFTPPEVVNQMLDMLPQELFKNPDTTFLDPACKTGVFLREIAKRLIKGLEPQIPDLQERLDHIFHKQLFGIAITELTGFLSRRSVYCSKFANIEFSVSLFDDEQGNIRFRRIKHAWKDGKCIYCSASRDVYDRSDELETHAYEWIHTNKPEEIFNMKFDVIIGNPPYQLSDGGAGASAMPIYNLFVEQSKKLKPRYLTMIIPARWFAGGRALDKFRADMLNDASIRKLVDFQQSKDCFPGVDIAGGVCYFLWDRDNKGVCEVTNVSGNDHHTEIRSLNSYNVFVRNNIGFNIIQKILKAHDYKSVNTIMANYNPFLIRSFVRGESEYFAGSISLHSSKGVSFINREIVTKNIDLIDKYKVTVSKVTSEHAGEADRNGQYRVLSSLKILSPGEICSESYVVMGTFDKKEEAENLHSYLKSKFARFLTLQAATSINLTKDTFQFVPTYNFSKTWTDEELYKKYNLTEEEIEFIESTIKPMEIGGDN